MCYLLTVAKRLVPGNLRLKRRCFFYLRKTLILRTTLMLINSLFILSLDLKVLLYVVLM